MRNHRRRIFIPSVGSGAPAGGGGGDSFDGVLRADFESGADLTVGDGTLTGTLVGGAAVSGGYLDPGAGHVQYDADDGNFQPTTTMTVNVIFQPEYTGSPADNQVPWFWGRDSDTRNGVWLSHGPTGEWTWWCRTPVAWINSTAFTGTWSPTTGVDYELELNMDLVTGATRLFIDGTQFGDTKTGTGSLTVPDTGFDQWIRIGDNANAGSQSSDFKCGDFKVWDTIQHTSDY
jgi:hypothetical protein